MAKTHKPHGRVAGTPIQLQLIHRHSSLHPADIATHPPDLMSTLSTASTSSVTRKAHCTDSAFPNQGELGATQNILQYTRKLKGTMQRGISLYP